MNVRSEDGYQYNHNQTQRLHKSTQRPTIFQLDGGCHLRHHAVKTTDKMACPACIAFYSDTNSLPHTYEQQLLCTPTQINTKNLDSCMEHGKHGNLLVL